jgi:hypothetical protein
VDLPFYDQGAKAVEILLAQLKGETVPALITLPSGLVVRQSCGCPSEAVTQAAYISGRPDQKIVKKATRKRLLASKSDCLLEMAAQAHVNEEKVSEWITPSDALWLKSTSLLRILSAHWKNIDRAMRKL